MFWKLNKTNGCIHIVCYSNQLFIYFHDISFFTKNVIILQYNLEIDMHALDALCVNTPGVWSSI